MWPYWMMLFLPAVMAYREARLPTALGRNSVEWTAGWWAVFMTLALLVGWRHEVGGDWFNYLENFDQAYYPSLWEVMRLDDPGYRLLEWIALEIGWGIYGVNLLAAMVFSYGLVAFCRHLPRPWLALCVAIPYFVIILGMGYSRQGMALGCIMVGLVALGQRRLAVFVGWALLAATFHKSAVLLLPIAALAASKRRFVTAAWVVAVVAAAYVIFLQDAVENLRVGYLEQEYQSEGALIRLLMNVLPATLLLLWRKQFSKLLPQKLWLWFAVFAFVLLGWYYVSPSSTAVDRVGLYLLPLQLVVFAYLPEVFGARSGRNNQGMVILILIYYATVQFVWLNFATHAFAWLPYRWYPLEWLFA